ncbi:MAG: beta-galactosidase, partial [Clostridiales bacterium]|nr:beta-galactosidase [Clostridiales bacterium]
MLRIRVSALLLCFILLMGVTAVGAADSGVNLTRLAGVTLSTNVPELGGHGLGLINDGAYDSSVGGFATRTDVLQTTPWPHYIDIDFGENIVQAATMSLHAFYASGMAVTDLDLAYWIDGGWRNVREGLTFRWTTMTGDKAETRSAFINSRYTTTKIRIIIKGANLAGGDYRIDELEIFGKVTGTLERNVASAPGAVFALRKAGDNASLPKSAAVVYSTGVSGMEEVAWEEADFSVPGTKTISGTLVNYPEVRLKTHTAVWQPDAAYTDLQDDLLRKSVTLLAQEGLFWDGGTLFRPNAPLTRLELAQMLYAAKKAVPLYADFYDDIDAEHFYYGVIGAVANANLAEIFAGERFDAETPVTGAEFGAAFGIAEAADATAAITRGAAAIALTRSIYGDISNQTLKVFRDNGKAVQNPDMGFMIYYYDCSTVSYDSKLDSTDLLEDIPGTNTVYLRFPWCHIEPEEGVFNWSFIDTQIQRFAQAGKSVMLGVT